jgi:AcrR family transcriptional regulator
MATDKAARWQRRKGARPAEIMEAALESFRERGFASTRLEEVAARAGVTKGTIYLYYPSKEALFKEVVRGEVGQRIAQMESLVAEPIPAPVLLERLFEIWQHVIDSPLSVIPKLVIAEAGNFPELARFYLETVVHRGLGLIAKILRRGIAERDFRPVDVDNVVYCVIGPLLLTALWKHSLGPHDDRPMDAAAVLRAHLDLLIHGLKTQGKQPARRSPRRPRKGAQR